MLWKLNKYPFSTGTRCTLYKHSLRLPTWTRSRSWLAQVDSNHRPRAYQARALTTWAMSHYLIKLGTLLSVDQPYLWCRSSPVVEMMGFEPMTPCLQGRCSPNWATPPYFKRFLLPWKDPSKLNNKPYKDSHPSDYIRSPNIADSP